MPALALLAISFQTHSEDDVRRFLQKRISTSPTSFSLAQMNANRGARNSSQSRRNSSTLQSFAREGPTISSDSRQRKEL